MGTDIAAAGMAAVGRRSALALGATLAVGGFAGVARAATLPREVLALYYGWYTPDFPASARFTPAAGGYNSDNVTIIAQQCSRIAAAGITGLVASWWPFRGTYTDHQLALLIPIAARYGLKVSIIMEEANTTLHPAPVDAMVSDLDYVLSSYGAASNWLKVAGRPVIFVYGRALHQLAGWAAWNQALARLRALHPRALLIADGITDMVHNPENHAAFDGLCHFGLASIIGNMSLAQIMQTLPVRYRQAMANAPIGKIGCLAVQSGYDDSQTTRPKPRPIISRNDGQTYAASWRAAIAANPDWILVSSFNEWIEGSQIEPSVQFGNLELTMTPNLAKSFLLQPPRQ